MIVLALPSAAGIRARIRNLVRPQRPALATEAAGGWGRAPENEQDASTAIAPRDGGWAELMTADGRTRMGRGHLMLWPARPATDVDDGESGPAMVDKDAGMALGGDAPPLAAELRSFAIDAGPPIAGDSLAVRPESEFDLYPVTVRAFDRKGDHPVVYLDWPDEELPASLRELGGN